MTSDHPPRPRRRLVAAMTVVGVLLVGATLSVNWLAARPEDAPLAGPSPAKGPPPSSQPVPPKLFQGWPAGKPEVAIVLSGQQHSYLKFCGCSSPQLGGFERRYNFIAKLRVRGWPVVAFDLGDLVTRLHGSLDAQTLLKYETAMKALEILGYSAIGLGENEHKLPLIEGLSRFTLQKPNAYPRVLAGNLKERLEKFPHPIVPNQSMIGDWLAVGGKDGVPKVGVVSLVGRRVTTAVTNLDASTQFDDNGKVIPGVTKAMDAQAVGFKVLLYHGDIDEAKLLAGDPKLLAKLPANIRAQVKTFPNVFDVILCLSAEEEPPAQPDVVGKTMIVRIGHRGRYVGVVGVYKTGKPDKPFDLHYQFIAMGEEYETDKDKEKDHRVIQLLEEYAKEVKSQNFLASMPKATHEVQRLFPNEKVTFVGSSACQSCHQAEYAIWAASKHSHAYEALTKYAVKPKLRQYDPECIVCHSVGYAYQSGYTDEVKTKHLLHVGCENCHGPGSLHVQNAKNPAYYPHLSPYKAQPQEVLPKQNDLAKGLDALQPAQKQILLRVDQMCQKCHDTDNDPHFKFEKYWPVIAHGKDNKPWAKKVQRPAPADVPAVVPAKK